MRRKRQHADGPEEIGGLVRQAVRNARPSTPARDRLGAAFALAAGDDIATQVRVRGRRGVRLLLETSSPALLSELRSFRAQPILARWPADPPGVPVITQLSVRLAGDVADPDPGRTKE